MRCRCYREENRIERQVLHEMDELMIGGLRRTCSFDLESEVDGVRVDSITEGLGKSNCDTAESSKWIFDKHLSPQIIYRKSQDDE